MAEQKRKKNDRAEAAGVAIAAGVVGTGLGGGGRISYLPRLSDRTDIDLSSELRSNELSSCSLLINGTPVQVQRLKVGLDSATFEINGRQYTVELVQSVPERSGGTGTKSSASTAKSIGAPGEIISPLPGIVSEIVCKVGDQVTLGQLVIRIEAMKMQNNVYANLNGRVDSLLVAAGEEVAAGQLLLKISP